MRILNFWHRLHAELAALQAAWRADRERAQQIKYRRALRKRRVVMPQQKAKRDALPPPRPETIVRNWQIDQRAR